MIKILHIPIIFVFGLAIGIWVFPYHQPKAATYAFQPEDCRSAGMNATGWEVSRTYHGGIGAGGITAAIEYECR